MPDPEAWPGPAPVGHSPQSLTSEPNTATAIKALGRIGYVARALLYASLGVLTCKVAVTGRGRADFAGTFVALNVIGGRPLLVVLACGLWGYAVWRWTEAARNPERRSLWSRGDIAARGVIYAWLGVVAARFALGGILERRPARHWVDLALGYPMGQAVVFAVGAFLAAFVWNEATLARRGTVSAHLQSAGPAPQEWWAVRFASRLGMAARAAAFGTMAAALLQVGAGATSVPVDMADLFQGLSRGYAGAGFLFATGIGLMSYAVYLAVLAWMRRLPV
jgi:hypothetical protein